MAKTKNKQREEFLEKKLEEHVFNQADFDNHVTQVSKHLNYPDDVVRAVIKNFFGQIPKILYSKSKKPKRINVFGYFNFNIKSRIKKK